MKFLDISEIRVTIDEPLPARDGTRLSVDIYRPPKPGRYPTLVTRTPYDNNRTGIFSDGSPMIPRTPADQFKRLAAQGFVVVACDVRGRGDSDGSFVPFVNELQDGADTVDWARALPECDGTVGLFGSGYAGLAALAAAAEAKVDAVAVWSPFGTETVPFRGGALRLEWLLWLHLAGGRTLQPAELTPWTSVLRHRPLLYMDEALGREGTVWREWLEGGSAPRALDFESRLPSRQTPTLFVTGWWDGFLESTVSYWEQAGGTDPASAHALLIGPWDAESVRRPSADTGGVAWGHTAVLDPEDLLVEWFGGHLREDGVSRRGARVFVTGRNEWTAVDLSDGAQNAQVLWLSSRGRANTRRGDGRLSSAPVGDEPPDRFVHDPDRPVTFLRDGAPFLPSTDLLLDTSFVTSRDDVLVYDGEPVASALSIRGRPIARLWVETDAADADWVVAIEDVFPGGGPSVHLGHGVVRMGSLDGGGPGRPTELTIRMTPVSHELLPGHRIRLLVASSLWPLYAVNLGGSDYLRDTEARLSAHTILHDSRHPSTLELPSRPGPPGGSLER